MLVHDCMTVNPPTIAATAPFGEVLERMQALRIGRLLVLEGGRLVGIVTRTDMMRALLPPAARSATEGVPEILGRPVRNVMTKDPVVIQPQVPVEQAARILHERMIQALPVVDGRELVGLVTNRDLVGALARLLGGDIRGIRMDIDLPSDLHDVRKLVEALTTLEPAVFPLALTVRLDNLERRARLRAATPWPLLVAETLAAEGFQVAKMQFDHPGGGKAPTP